MYCWSQPGDLDCTLCPPRLRKLRGCTAAPDEPIPFPPTTVEYHGERWVPDRCPTRLITPDLDSLFAARRATDGRLSLTEMNELPQPYIDAWLFAAKHEGEAASARMKSR